MSAGDQHQFFATQLELDFISRMESCSLAQRLRYHDLSFGTDSVSHT